MLHSKYELPKAVAMSLGEFLQPMLDFNPATRARASKLIEHDWLKPELDVEKLLTLESGLSLTTDPTTDALEPSGEEPSSREKGDYFVGFTTDGNSRGTKLTESIPRAVCSRTVLPSVKSAERRLCNGVAALGVNSSPVDWHTAGICQLPRLWAYYYY
mgnify:CR=1 FL=1